MGSASTTGRAGFGCSRSMCQGAQDLGTFFWSTASAAADDLGFELFHNRPRLGSSPASAHVLQGALLALPTPVVLATQCHGPLGASHTFLASSQAKIFTADTRSRHNWTTKMPARWGGVRECRASHRARYGTRCPRTQCHGPLSFAFLASSQAKTFTQDSVAQCVPNRHTLASAKLCPETIYPARAGETATRSIPARAGSATLS